MAKQSTTRVRRARVRLLGAIVALASLASCDWYRDEVKRSRYDPCLLGGEKCSASADCCDHDCFANRCWLREP